MSCEKCRYKNVCSDHVPCELLLEASDKNNAKQKTLLHYYEELRQSVKCQKLQSQKLQSPSPSFFLQGPITNRSYSNINLIKAPETHRAPRNKSPQKIRDITTRKNQKNGLVLSWVFYKLQLCLDGLLGFFKLLVAFMVVKVQGCYFSVRCGRSMSQLRRSPMSQKVKATACPICRNEGIDSNCMQP